MHEVGQVGPCVGGGLPTRQRATARPWIAGDSALRRPFRDHVEVLGPAPGCVGLEHAVLQHELMGVGPVVRDVGASVVPHHVLRFRGIDPVAIRVHCSLAATHGFRGLGHETGHLPAVDVADAVPHAVRPAEVEIVAIVIRLHTRSHFRVGRAHRRDAARVTRKAIRSRIGSEVAVEGSVLLHDDHHVLNLVDPRQRRNDCERGPRRARSRGEARDGQAQTDCHTPPTLQGGPHAHCWSTAKRSGFNTSDRSHSPDSPSALLGGV